MLTVLMKKGSESDFVDEVESYLGAYLSSIFISH
jgi:hypothetical protein